jgi:drug/metabolite transporter (DMT)-like permease
MTMVTDRIQQGQNSTVHRLHGHHQLFGAALVVLSAAAIAIVPTFAKLAYDGGSDTLTVITARSIVSAAACLLVMTVLGRSLIISRSALTISVMLGLIYAVHLYGLLRAVAYLPVNTVIVVYYLHPLIIGFVAILLGRKTISIMNLGALIGAIIGLGLAVGLSFYNLNLTGLVLALMAAAGAAVVYILITQAKKNFDT